VFVASDTEDLVALALEETERVFAVDCAAPEESLSDTSLCGGEAVRESR
jgi:hypothetical protein